MLFQGKVSVGTMLCSGLFLYGSQSCWQRTLKMYYRKFPKYSDTQNICCNHSKIWTMWLYHRVMSPKDADGMANSVDPDQTAPVGAVWSGSTLFAQTCLSENLGKLRYNDDETVTLYKSAWKAKMIYMYSIHLFTSASAMVILRSFSSLDSSLLLAKKADSYTFSIELEANLLQDDFWQSLVV